jgi:hypothetical protein
MWSLDIEASIDMAAHVQPRDQWSVAAEAEGAWRRDDGMLVLMTVEVSPEGKRWIHVSVSLQHRIPTFSELATVKEWIIGRERRAIHVWPRESEKINIHPNCIHIWSCLDGDGLPDFRREGGL